MGFRFCVLGSGSGGNSTLLQIDEADKTHHILLDAGLSPKETEKRLSQQGIGIEMIESILVTHMHGDHFRDAWLPLCKQHTIRVLYHRKHARLWWKKTEYGIKVKEFSVRFFLTPSTSVRPILLPHDQQWSTGMLFEYQGAKLGFMTDLGHLPEKAYAHFHGVDILAIESNYDKKQQEESSRPRFLKERIMSPVGHLSNQQSIDAVKRFAEKTKLEKIVLLHLSQQCNSPQLIEQLYREQAPQLLEKLYFTKQKEPSPVFTLKDTIREKNEEEERKARF